MYSLNAEISCFHYSFIPAFTFMSNNIISEINVCIFNNIIAVTVGMNLCSIESKILLKRMQFPFILNEILIVHTKRTLFEFIAKI